MDKTIRMLMVLLCFSILSLSSMDFPEVPLIEDKSPFTDEDTYKLLKSFRSSQETLLRPIKSIKNCRELSQRIDEFVKQDSSFYSIEKLQQEEPIAAYKQSIKALNKLYPLIPDKIKQLDQPQIFAALTKRNALFKFLIDRCMYQKAMDLENVNGKTLDTVLSAEHSFEDLVPSIKKYILKKVSDDFYKINGKTYYHVLKEHTDVVRFALSYTVKHNAKNVKHLLVTVSDDKTIRLWNWKTGKYDHTYVYDGIVTDIDHSADGKWLAIANGSNDIILLNSQTYITKILPHEKPVCFVSWNHLLDEIDHVPFLMTTCSSKNNRAYLWDITELSSIMIAYFPLPQTHSKRLSSRALQVDIKSNEVHCPYTSNYLTLCFKAINNALTHEDIKEISLSNRVQNLPKITQPLFNEAIKQKLAILMSEQIL